MSEAVRLEVKRRDRSGSRASRRLRGEGQVPAVLYGHGKESVPLSVDGKEMRTALAHHARFLELALDGAIETALVREVQTDVFGIELMHIDLVRVDLDEPVEVTVAVELRGQPKGVSEGGVLELHMADVPIRCVPRAIPDSIVVPVADLGLHAQVHLGDLVLPEGAELADDPGKVVLSIVMKRVLEAAPAAGEEGAAGAEPEVVGGGEKPASGEGGE